MIKSLDNSTNDLQNKIPEQKIKNDDKVNQPDNYEQKTKQTIKDQTDL